MKASKALSTTISKLDTEEQLAVKGGQECPPFIHWEIDGYIGVELSTNGLYYHVWMGYYVGSYPADTSQ